MASLLETLTADRKAIANQRASVDEQRQLLEADADEAKSYDSVREPLSKLDEEITAHDRKLSGLDRDITRETARRERVRATPSARDFDEDQEALEAA